MNIDLDRDELLTLSEAAHRLRIDPATAYRWALKNKLPCWRRGGRIVTTKAAVDALLVPLETAATPGPAFGQEQRQGQSLDKWSRERLEKAGLL